MTMTGILLGGRRERLGTETQGKGHAELGTETRIMYSQIKECEGLPAASTQRRRGREGVVPQSLEEHKRHLDFGHLASRTRALRQRKKQMFEFCSQKHTLQNC